MNKAKNIILIVLILAVVIGAAALGYGYLSQEYAPEPAGNTLGDPVKAPDFTVIDEAGNRVNLSDFRGKPVIVNFWATWCGPCKTELPYFEAAYKQYGEQVEFVMLNVDGGYETVEDAKNFARTGGYSFPLYFDVLYDASQTYGVSAIPATMCVSAEGEVVWSKVGMLYEKELIAQIENLIGVE